MDYADAMEKSLGFGVTNERIAWKHQRYAKSVGGVDVLIVDDDKTGSTALPQELVGTDWYPVRKDQWSMAKPVNDPPP